MRIVEDLQSKKYLPSIPIAMVYSGLGDKSKAFQWLETGYQERSGWMIFLPLVPAFNLLRSDPRYADLMQRVGLPPHLH